MNLLSFFAASAAIHAAVILLPVEPGPESRRELTAVTLHYEAEPTVVDHASEALPPPAKRSQQVLRSRKQTAAARNTRAHSTQEHVQVDTADFRPSTEARQSIVEEKIHQNHDGNAVGMAATILPNAAVESPGKTPHPAPAEDANRLSAAPLNLPPGRSSARQTPDDRAAQAATADAARSDAAQAVTGVQYAYTPPPRYPDRAKRAGWQGTVLLQVSVDPAGLASKVEIDHSSGYAVLDEAARQTVEEWRFHPARIGARPIRSTVKIPVVFKLLEVEP